LIKHFVNWFFLQLESSALNRMVGVEIGQTFRFKLKNTLRFKICSGRATHSLSANSDRPTYASSYKRRRMMYRNSDIASRQQKGCPRRIIEGCRILRGDLLVTTPRTFAEEGVDDRAVLELQHLHSINYIFYNLWVNVAVRRPSFQESTDWQPVLTYNLLLVLKLKTELQPHKRY